MPDLRSHLPIDQLGVSHCQSFILPHKIAPEVRRRGWVQVNDALAVLMPLDEV